jgi:acyl carrier protein
MTVSLPIPDRAPAAAAMSPQDATWAVPPQDAVLDVLRQVLDVQEDAVAGPIEPGSKLDDLGVDSMLLAEFIVELEERLCVLLELRPDGRLVTVADLGRALHLVSAWEPR